MAEASKSPSLAALLAQPVEVPLGGGIVTLQIRPMGWDLAAQATPHIAPVLEMAPVFRAQRAGGEHPDDADLVAYWLGVAASYREEVVKFCAIAAGLDEAELRELPPALMVELVLALLEINADFFALCLSGVLTRAAGRLERLKQALGAAGSTTSSSA